MFSIVWIFLISIFNGFTVAFPLPKLLSNTTYSELTISLLIGASVRVILFHLCFSSFAFNLVLPFLMGELLRDGGNYYTFEIMAFLLIIFFLWMISSYFFLGVLLWFCEGLKSCCIFLLNPRAKLLTLTNLRSFLVLGLLKAWVQQMDNSTLYLGVPHVLGRRKNLFYHFIINKYRNKVENWHNKNLSKAGKLIIIKSVLQNLSIHVKLPSFVIKQFTRDVTSFWWNSKDISRKIQWCLGLIPVSLKQKEG